MVDVAIIGAGISGLAAAHYASKAGSSVVLYEAGELGGVIRTSFVDGFMLEQGFMHAFGQQLAQAVGFADPGSHAGR